MFSFWPSLAAHYEESFLAVLRRTERKSARGYVKNAETLRTTDYADGADPTMGSYTEGNEDREDSV